MRAAPKYTISTSGRHTIATLIEHYHRPAISQEKVGITEAVYLTCWRLQ